MSTTTGAIRPFKEEWKNYLQSVKNEFHAANYGEFLKANGEVRGKWDDTTANGLTSAIIDYLRYKGGNFSRINSMGTPRKSAGGGFIFTPSTMKKGIADIVGCFKGLYIAIEVKIGADRQSDEQKQEEKDVTNAGGIYFIAKSFPDFISKWNLLIQNINK